MRLVICFHPDELRDISLRDDDIVLFDGIPELEKGIFVDINDSLIDFNSLNSEYSEVLKFAESSNLLDRYYLDLLKSASNNLYFHNFRYLNLWIKSINEVLNSNTFDSILLTSLINKGNYTPFYESEGEVTKKLFYMRFDFISPIIFSHLKKLGHKKIILVHRKRSILARGIRIFLRRDVLLFVKLTFHLIRWLKFSVKRDSPNFDVDSLVLSRGIAHSNYFFPLLKYKGVRSLVLVSDGLYGSDVNYNSLKKRQINAVNLYSVLSWRDIFLAYIKSFWKVIKLRVIKLSSDAKRLRNIGFFEKISIIDVLVEMQIFQLEVDIYSAGLSRVIRKIKNPNVVVLNGEMISQYPLWIDKVCKSFERKHFQVQTASMDVVSSPNFIYSQKFCLSSLADLNKFREVGDSKTKDSFSFIGNLSLNLIDKTSSQKLTSLVYFSQPYEDAYQLEILQSLLSLAKEINFSFFIKLHPREVQQEYIVKYNLDDEDFGFVQSDLNIYEISSNYSVALTRTSSVVQDLILLGMPVIACPFSPYDKQLSFEFLDERHIHVMHSVDRVKSTLLKFEDFQDQYHESRLKYIEQTGINLGINSFVKHING